MDSFYSHFKEAGKELPYSKDHQAEDIKAIKQVIEINSSLFIFGHSGSGKSSVLRFLVSNPAVQSDNMFFVYIDCNGLDWDNTIEAVQEEICIQVIERLQTLNFAVPEGDRPKAYLKALVKEFSKQTAKHLVIIFDRSELVQSNLDTSFFDYLRSLRDLNGRLSYIFSGRLLNQTKFGELTDILWGEPHWIGSLSVEDAKWTIKRHLIRLKIDLTEDEIDKLLACTGAHPGLLKYACELVKSGKVKLDTPKADIIVVMLATDLIQRQCQDLWQDLDLKAQQALRDLDPEETNPPPIVDWLVRCGVLTKTEDGKVVFVSPIFEGYVSRLGPPPLMVRQGMVFKGAEVMSLAKEEFALFWKLWEMQPNIVSKDQIIDAVWSENYEISDQMITNIVKRLRDKLEDNRYINNVRGRGYQFIQGSAPLPRSDSDTSKQTR